MDLAGGTAPLCPPLATALGLKGQLGQIFKVEVKAKARSFRIKATYAYEILHDYEAP